MKCYELMWHGEESENSLVVSGFALDLHSPVARACNSQFGSGHLLTLVL